MDINKMYSREVRSIRRGVIAPSPNRYENKNVIINGDGDQTRLLKLNELKAPLRQSDLEVTLELKYQYDPWRLANDHYNDPALYWVILAANDLSSFTELVEGSIIRLPDPNSIFGGDGGLTVLNDAT